ncbi:RdgB/HAM1 family non-canonical purine NTP pyrophosphatase [Taibaiella soli]|uniref:dITP/XTP pyrophosphatase n=1 Tax=Taibaiella soli TaxID=1649169 RepID=A0A2W2AU37_9BACT|nr:RdgB/HAM1 family non-canonical purine NTP pyrophosphatase [Taibaiella soli]PZF71228.1 non-canonical purine NTP pyrophosphatase, RdgB/HAM1 family [Taibaiella soli]
MKELVIASNNQGKIREIRHLLQDFELLSLADISFTDEIEEPYDTFEENAQVKAATIFNFSGKNVFADDSGICVDALNGAPGVFSARYAGEPKDDDRNLQLVLENIKNATNRAAHYKAVICLIWEEQTYFFEGICRGTLLDAPRGGGGFGYDPIFVPDGYDQTFAELSLDIKNQISHRGKALKAMAAFLNEGMR